MRPIDPTLKAKLLEAYQTLYNNAEPNVEAIVSRPTTPITSKNYWEETIVTENVTSICTSVAIQKTGRYPEKAYVAYVDDSNVLVVKSADLVYPITRMVWEVEETIENCLACAVDFDGSFVRASRDKVEFRTEETPWLFYVTSTGQLMAGVLGGSYESLVGANVTAIDAVRGVASKYKDIDQGLLVFYVIAGSLYYRDLIDGVWGGQTSVSIAPADIVSVRAERTFDYRIVLQVTDTSGSLHEIFTKMESSGWQATEQISASLSVATVLIAIDYLYNKSADERITAGLSVDTALLYALSPVMVSAENVIHNDSELEIEDDYGYKVVLHWDERVFDATGNEASFSMVDEASAVFRCTLVEKTGIKEITLLFQNFNNATGDLTLLYTPGTMMGEVVAIEADSFVFTPTGLVPFATEPPVPVSIENIEGWFES